MVGAMYPRFLTMCVFAAVISACGGDVYLHDGVTDGDTFYLAPRALTDPDPAVQSWVGYSLGKSACQLQHEGENPARATSFECELAARKLLLETWSEKVEQDPEISDSYLEVLSAVHETGDLREYVARYFSKSDWILPDDLRTQKFRQWQRHQLPGHRPQTILTGSWNYRSRVTNY